MRIRSIILALGAMVPFGVAAPGCVENACFLQVCDGPYCRCSISTCGEGAAWDNQVRRCRCQLGTVLIGGHCLSQQQANSFCGSGYTFQNGGCLRNQCRPGDELDHTSGLCIPHEQVNQVANNLGINVGPGQKLGCPAGQKLVLDGKSAACVPLSQTCARDEQWNGQTCARVSECPAGSTWDAGQARCVQFAQGSNDAGLAVNVTQWAYASYGPDGGNGTTAFCNAFARKPWSFGVVDGSSAMIRVTVTLSFPENQIARGTVQAAPLFASSGHPVPAKGAAEVDAAAKAAFAPLVHQGGKAATPAATTAVKCLVVNAGRPQAVPATGGL
jgi:hypothetical protein